MPANPMTVTIGDQTLEFDSKKQMLKRVGYLILRGYDQPVTLRQLYYQFVGHDLVENKISQYQYLSEAMTEARIDGLIPWEWIEDRTRQTHAGDHNDGDYVTPDSRFRGNLEWFRNTPDRFHRPRWQYQPKYVEVWCFPPDTPVMTVDGSKPIQSVREGDRVYGQGGELERVVETMSRPYEGDLIEIDSRANEPIRTTPDHRVLAVKSRRSKGREHNLFDREKEWVPASELSARDVLVVPRTKPTGAVATIDIGFGEVPIGEDFLYIAGLYVSDGSTHSDGRSVKWTMNDERLIKRVKGYFERHGLNVSVDGGTATDTRISNKALADRFRKLFGEGAPNKRLPEQLMQLGREKTKALLDGLVDGDGSVDVASSKVSYSSTSPNLVRQVRMLFQRLGYTASFYRHYRAEDNPLANYDVYETAIAGSSARRWMGEDGRGNGNNTWVGDEYHYTPVREVSRVPYSGTVYNFETATTNTYCVPFAVHNCEKEALAGIFADICDDLKVVTFPSKGYTSITLLHEAADRISSMMGKDIYDGGPPVRSPYILYFGDFDPSGQDIERNIREKMQDTFHIPVEVERCALTREQVDTFELPPQPAKRSDARYEQFVAEHGDMAVELDALPPEDLRDLIRESVEAHFDDDVFEGRVEPRQTKERETLRGYLDDVLVADEVAEWLDG